MENVEPRQLQSLFWDRWSRSKPAYAQKGMPEDATTAHQQGWLEAGLNVRFSFMPRIEIELGFAPLRYDPRFQDLVRRMNLPTNENR